MFFIMWLIDILDFRKKQMKILRTFSLAVALFALCANTAAFAGTDNLMWVIPMITFSIIVAIQIKVEN